MVRLLALLVALSALVTMTAAERGFVPIRRAEGAYVALVIGNGAYSTSPLANPVNDATDVALAFASIGFRVTRVLDADREQMAAAVTAFGASLRTAQAAVFYYAGHGTQVEGENWLLPIGRTAATEITDEGHIPFRAFNAGEVIAQLDQAKVPLSLVVLDACRNNPFKVAGRGGQVQGLASINAPIGSLVFYATKAGSVANDGTGRNSPFTAAFLKHLLTPGLDVRLLSSEITNTVSEMTNGAQTPGTYTQLRQGFCFVPPLSEAEKFTAEKSRKEEELRQEEMQAKLRDLSGQARTADAAQQQQLATERTRVEAALAASKQASADLTRQLEADLAAARDQETADLATARKSADAALAVKQQEIAALDAKIAALKVASPQGGAGTDADLDQMVAVMDQRTQRRAELARMEREAKAARQKAATEAAEKRRQEEAAATARRQRAEAEAESKRQAALTDEQAKATELARLQAAERQALADRLECDLAKYRRLSSSDDGKDMAPVAWAKICAMYRTGDVRLGDEDELTERVLPGTRAAAAAADSAADRAFADGGRPALDGFASRYPQHARAAEARRQASLIPAWAQGTGKDQSGTWAKLVVRGQTQVLRLIPAGSFRMGSENGGTDQKPVHEVVISQPFWLGDSEVTQAMWQAVMGNNPSNFTGDANRPVEQVSWDDCHGFIQKLNGQAADLRSGLRGLHSGLPTEAQWEYACRAGTTGDYAGDLPAMAWNGENSDKQTHAVKTKHANAWGLFDMHGNVGEWCSDWYGGYVAGFQRDPTGPSSGSGRVHRGGSWYGDAGSCWSAGRFRFSPDNRSIFVGFRLAAQATP